MWKSKRGTIDEAMETPPYLAIAGILILVSLGLAVRWFYMMFVDPPDKFDSYAEANFERLGEEIKIMLETNGWQNKVIPYSLIGHSPGLGAKRRSLIGINPDLDPPSSSGCNSDGAVVFPDYCGKYPCLCLCHATECENDKTCITFKHKEYGKRVRFVGVEQSYNPSGALCSTGEQDFNTGAVLPYDLDPLSMDSFSELVLYPFCGASSTCGWGEYDNTGYLYVEETRGEDGYTYILIGIYDEQMQEREEALINLRETGDEPDGCVPMDRCVHSSECNGETGSEAANQECKDVNNDEFVCCMADDVEICRWDGDYYTFGERKCGDWQHWWSIGQSCGTDWSCGCNMEGKWTLNKIDCDKMDKVCAQGQCVIPK